MRSPTRPIRLLAATRPLLLLLVWATALPVGAGAQEAPPFELPAWERELPFAELPHPRDVFGFDPGADHRLADHAQIVEYFDRLDAASDRVLVERIGETVLGRPMILAYISSAENIRRLEEHRSTAESLARGRLPAAEAARRAATGKAVVWIDGGLHSTEVASAQHTPLLGWRVAAEETEEMRRIRDDVILLLMPVMNPDGLDIVVDWVEQSRDTPWAESGPPVLYHHYTGHDNNRDWFMMTQPETRAVADVLYNRWYPQIVLNQHQTAPWPARIFIPPFADPVNPRIPALVVRGVNTVGEAMGTRFSEEGKPGAVSRITFDMWWNGGMRTAPYYHNMVGILTETAHRSVAPRYTSPESLPAYIGGTLPATAPSVFYPDPWPGGWFRLRDAVEYMVTAAMATLEVASEQRESWLHNIWHMGAEAVAAGEAGEDGPFAYVIPPSQRKPLEAANLVRTLRRGGVEVHRAERAFGAGETRVPAGSYIVLTGQAFRPYILDLMEPHEYPDMRLYPGGPPDTPYDISGWTLPIQMDVDVVPIPEPFDTERLAAVDEPGVWPGRLVGEGRWGWAMAPSSNASAIVANRVLARGGEVRLAEEGVRAHDQDLGPGTYLIRGVGEGELAELAADHGVDLVGVGRAPSGELPRLRAPRIGIYRSWQANMDEGWTRWVLDQYAFPVDTLRDADIRGRDLSGYDAIILPDQGPRRILHGYEEGTRPTGMTGGIGLDGMLRLREYVQGGGRLIAFDAAGELLIEQLNLPLRNAVSGLPSDRFFVPGTLIRTTIDRGSPLAWGMDDEAAAFFVRSSAYRPTRGEGVEVVARYAEDDLVLSGWALGEDRYLAGRAAVVRVEVGAGDVVLFGFRPQFRGQPRGTFRLLFNALHGAALEEARVSTGREAGARR